MTSNDCWTTGTAQGAELRDTIYTSTLLPSPRGRQMIYYNYKAEKPSVCLSACLSGPPR